MTVSFKIRAFTESDLNGLLPLQPEGWGDLSVYFGTYLSIPSCHPVAVTVNGTVAGTGCAIGLGKTGWLAHVIVAPDYQKQGIGSAIVKHCMDDLLSRGCETVSLVATDQGYPRYLAAGFRDQTEYVFFERSREPEPHTPFGNMDSRDLEAVLRMDHEYSGEDRSPFIIPRTTGGLVFRQDGITTGFWLPALGEGLIVAADQVTGRMITSLRSRVSGRCVLPAENTEGLQILTSQGFQETKRCKRMLYGRGFAWKPEGFYSRIGGYLG